MHGRQIMTANPQIAAIVLAAGQSKRAGPVNKLLSPIDGRVMVRTVVETLTSQPINPVIVVSGFEAPEVAAALSGCRVTFAHNPEFAEGMGGSIGCGITALPDGVDGALICLGDMPHVKADTISQLIGALRDQGICVPVMGGRRGNPVLFAKSHFAALKSIDGDRGGKKVMDSNPDHVVEVAVDDGGIFIDHDKVG